MIRVGPAGWTYDDWKGVVYPERPGKGFDPLAYISSYFDTIEVNSTFYRPAAPKAAESWARRVQHNKRFRFTAKLWQRFTHERDTPWTSAEVRQVRAGLDPLADAGLFGALLLQFPWSFKREPQSLGWLDALVREFHDYPLVLEVRHSSWEAPEFLDTLRDLDIGFVNIDQPQFGHSIGPTAHATGRVGYVRVHGRNYQNWFRKDAQPHERYDYLYTADELRPWAERAQAIEESGVTREVYVVTNNHVGGKGIANALMLRAMIEGQPVAAPPDVARTFGRLLEESGTAAPSAQASLF